MAKIINARYAGRCTRTGAPIAPGDRVLWHGRGRLELLAPDSDAAEFYAREYYPDEYAENPHAAVATARRLLASDARHGVVRFGSGAVIYRNPAGRCEDAPCCGCCSY